MEKMNFNFVSPTKIFFGKDKEKEVGKIIKNYGFSRLFLIYGGGSIKRSGLYERILSSLSEENIEIAELSGINANPSVEFVREGLKIARAFKPDIILAVGGGSVIDVAKSISVSYEYEGDPFDFNLKKAVPTKALPLGVILTISSAGSEASDSCVISDYETGIKQGFNNDLNRPLFAIENPELTYSVSKYQTAVGIADIMMHSLERYFNFSNGDLLSDEWALQLVKHVMKFAPIALEDPTNFDARAALMLDSTLSHNGLTGLGKKHPFHVHPLEHALSGYRPDIAHGAGVALIFPAWARYVYKQDLAKFAHMGEVLFEIKDDNMKKKAIISIDLMEKFFKSLGLPTSFKEVGIIEEDLPNLVALATGNGTRVIGCYPQSLEKKDVEAIFASLLR